MSRGLPKAYFDYMATTPVDPRVAKKMMGYLTLETTFGNPASSTHGFGEAAQLAVEHARQQVADCIKAESSCIVWTSGATESDNLAIKGAARFYQRKGKHIITLKTEHKAVLDSCGQLEREGFEVSYLTPDANGLLSLDTLKAALRPETILVSVMHVNNEIGVVQDIAAIGACLRAHGGVLFHVDAAQSIGKLAIDVEQMQVDLLSMTAHKVYGPKGIGALYVRQKPRVRLQAMIHGGGHEQGLRSGTLPTHQIVGMGEALAIAESEREQDLAHVSELWLLMWQGLASLPGVQLNGSATARYFGNLNVSFAGIDGEALLFALSDIAVSTASACASASIEPSYVLRALGLTDNLAHSAVRLSMGRFTTKAEVVMALALIQREVRRLRDLSPL